MERLQPRQEATSGVMPLAKKLMKLCLYTFLGIMTVVGLWFTVLWTQPVELPVELSVPGYIWAENGDQPQTVTVKMNGTYTKYRLANEADSFKGTVEIDGKQIPVEGQFEPGVQYARLSLTADVPTQILLSRDQKWMAMEYALDKNGTFTFLNEGTLHLMVMTENGPAQQALTAFQELLRENPSWQEGFRWKFG